jgi:hypothetical protein
MYPVATISKINAATGTKRRSGMRILKAIAIAASNIAKNAGQTGSDVGNEGPRSPNGLCEATVAGRAVVVTVIVVPVPAVTEGRVNR